MWGACEQHTVRYVKGETVSLGKYQQSVFNARRAMQLFAFDGFFFGIAARKLGLDRAPTPKAAREVPAAPEIVVGAATLSQTRVTADAVTLSSVNQLDRAATTYKEISNIHKSFLATSVLAHTADHHSAQAKALRNVGGNRTWGPANLTAGATITCD